MAEIDPLGDHSRQDGFLRACEGILRTRFGHRPFTAVARAIEQLAREERQNTFSPGQNLISRWCEAVMLWSRRWAVPLRAASLVVVVGMTLFLFSPGHVPERIEIGKFTAVMGAP